MERRARATFASQIPGKAVTGRGLEYYVEASDGNNRALFPLSAPAMPLSLSAYAVADRSVPGTPPATGKAFWYRIYRSDQPEFSAGPATLLTYVEQRTTSFRDNGEDLLGRKLAGQWYYRVAAVAMNGSESAPTAPVAITYESH